MSGRNPQITIADQIDAWLPQTQCAQCGYPRCRAYAEAVARGAADINQCPPGDEATIQALAALRHTAPKPLDPRFGSHKPRARAVIEETLCIGCRKCIDACPVDAIVGARKLMHTVLAHECTGCELCLPPCPVDCIVMAPSLTGHARSASGSDHTSSPLPQGGRGVGEREPSPPCGRGNEGEGAPKSEPWPEYTRAETGRWRARTEKHLERLARRKLARRPAASSAEPLPALPTGRERIRAEIRAAVERVKMKRKNRQD